MTTTGRKEQDPRHCFRVHIQLDKNNKRSADPWAPRTTTNVNGKIISYWCLSAGFGMKALIKAGVRCVILTSGTLAPLAALESELNLNMPIKLENPHIITDEQVWVGVLSKGPSGHVFNSSFRTRDDPNYLRDLGQMLINFARIIPKGMLVFFPSYSFLIKCRDVWQPQGIWTELCKHKPAFVEPQRKDEFNAVVYEYTSNILSAPNGACFLGVCRGKVSEGIDFADAMGRAVLIIGLPYPPARDPRVMLKQSYLNDQRRVTPSALSGDMWYQLEAAKAVNQAVGRVLRHRKDYGAIILCDERLDVRLMGQHLSHWARSRVVKCDVFGKAVRGVTEFFRTAHRQFPNTSNEAVVRVLQSTGFVNCFASSSTPVGGGGGASGGEARAMPPLRIKPLEQPKALSASEMNSVLDVTDSDLKRREREERENRSSARPGGAKRSSLGAGAAGSLLSALDLVEGGGFISDEVSSGSVAGVSKQLTISACFQSQQQRGASVVDVGSEDDSRRMSDGGPAATKKRKLIVNGPTIDGRFGQKSTFEEVLSVKDFNAPNKSDVSTNSDVKLVANVAVVRPVSNGSASSSLKGENGAITAANSAGAAAKSSAKMVRNATTAAEFMTLMKSLLSGDEYARVTAAIKLYHRNKDILTLAGSFQQMLRETRTAADRRHELYELFVEFGRRFVHKERSAFETVLSHEIS